MIFLTASHNYYESTPGTVKSGILGILGIPSCGQPTVELEKSVGKSMTLALSSLKSPPGECAFSRE